MTNKYGQVKYVPTIGSPGHHLRDVARSVLTESSPSIIILWAQIRGLQHQLAAGAGLPWKRRTTVHLWPLTGLRKLCPPIFGQRMLITGLYTIIIQEILCSFIGRILGQQSFCAFQPDRIARRRSFRGNAVQGETSVQVPFEDVSIGGPELTNVTC